MERAGRIYRALEEALEKDVPRIGRSGNAAVMIAELLENWYTCMEMAWLKISQHFENSLDKERWNADLRASMDFIRSL